MIIRPKYKIEDKAYWTIIGNLVKKVEDKSINIVDYLTIGIELKHEKTFEYLNAAILVQSLIKKEADENALSVGDYAAKVKAQEVTSHMAYHLGELVTNKLIEKKLFSIEEDSRKVPYLKLSHEDLQG
jgi:hypothetical protein